MFVCFLKSRRKRAVVRVSDAIDDLVDVPPRRRGRLLIEETALREQETAASDARDRRAALPLARF
jgi:hypothetical protein